VKGKWIALGLVITIFLAAPCSIFVDNVSAGGKYTNASGKGMYEIFKELDEPIGVAYFDVKVSEFPHPKHGLGYVKWKIDFANTDYIDIIVESTAVTWLYIGLSVEGALTADIEAEVEITDGYSNEVITDTIKVLLIDGTILSGSEAFGVEFGNEIYDYVADNNNLIRGNINIVIKNTRR